MWTSTIDLDFKKVLLAQLIGRFYRNIYFSSYSPLQVENLPRQPLPHASWVRVRNRLAGICGGDLHLLHGDGDLRVAAAAMPRNKRLYPGHEVVGEVIEIGNDVQHIHVGDRVALQHGPNCLTAGVQSPCRFCVAGDYNLCENSAFGLQPIGGGWSEEMLLHEQQLFQVPATLSDEQAVMIEPTAVALHAVLRRLPRYGERVLIIGAGSIGLSILQIVHALAPQSEVSVLARHDFQIERATRLGATHIIYPRDAYIGVKRATQARLYQGPLGNQVLSGGYDVVYDTVGQHKTVHHALRWTRAQGTLVLVGSSPHMMNLDLTPIWQQEINLLGSTSHGMEYWPIDGGTQRSTFSVVAELIEQGRVAPEQLITHHFALNNYKAALLTMLKKADSRAVKVVFDYSLLPASVVPNVRASARRPRPTTAKFTLDHSAHEQDQTEKVPVQKDKKQTAEAEEQAAPPALLETPYTPSPYSATIQDTPPIKASTKEMPRPAISVEPADEVPDDDDSEDTVTALPIVGRATPAEPAVEAEQYSPAPVVVQPHHDDSYQAFPLELEMPPSHIVDSHLSPSDSEAAEHLDAASHLSPANPEADGYVDADRSGSRHAAMGSTAEQDLGDPIEQSTSRPSFSQEGSDQQGVHPVSASVESPATNELHAQSTPEPATPEQADAPVAGMVESTETQLAEGNELAPPAHEDPALAHSTTNVAAEPEFDAQTPSPKEAAASAPQQAQPEEDAAQQLTQRFRPPSRKRKHNR